ncbi:MAG: lysylphosphatidylglycerol synthetase family protein [Bacteroidales bacterium]|nr:lysylphosphatidylglycerol synthetase family protein [Bacteroidales bacterium]
MKPKVAPTPFKILLKEKSIPFILENKKIIVQFIFTALFITLGVWFIRHEKAELIEVKNILYSTHANWIALGIALTVAFVLLMGLMYVFAFRSIGCRVGLGETTILFLKRNLISVFLPAGGVSSLAFFAGNLENRGISKSQVHFASSIYGFLSIFSVVLVAIPAFLFAVVQGNSSSSDWYALSVVVAILSVIVSVYISIKRKGRIYKWLLKISPSLEVFLDEMQNHSIRMDQFYYTLLASVLVEVVGITHVYLSMLALGLEPSLFAATMGYLIAVIFLLVSPFLRGLGAIEVSMTLVFTKFGFSNIESIAITFLFRFFEFWLPITAGIISFLNRANKYLMRMVPAVLLFFMGIINIVSFFLPAIRGRHEWLENILILDVINASNYFVLVAGVFLLVTAAFLLKGLKNAWWFAIVLLSVSFIAHLTRNVDYEDAFIALVIILVLIITRRQYYVKSNTHLRNVNLQTAMAGIGIVIIYGIVGFYSLDSKHFNNDFSVWQSVKYALENYLLLESPGLAPADAFAENFLLSLHIGGIITFSFLVYVLVSPLVLHKYCCTREQQLALEITSRFGKMPLDFYKALEDKLIFIDQTKNSFIAYRPASNFAIALGGPVAENDAARKTCINGFENFCAENSLKTIYFLVPETSLDLYIDMGKKAFCTLQEAIVDLNTLNSDSLLSSRPGNHFQSFKTKGYSTLFIEPPYDDSYWKTVKEVSDDWSRFHPHSGLTFIHGHLSEERVKKQSLLLVRNHRNQGIAFVSLVTDSAYGMPAIDLIRTTSDAPAGINEYLLVELILVLKAKSIGQLNLGIAPQNNNTILAPANRHEKYAYEKIRQFACFKGLHELWEKFNPAWKNCYLVYEQEYDLLEVPSALKKVFRPY